MSRPISKHPTELELQILKILWDNGPASVRAVKEALAETRPLAYTSVMTVMNIMVRKGYLRRRKEGSSYIYYPRVTKRTTTRRMLQDLIDRAFDGAAVTAAMHLLETADINEAELKRLRELIDQKSKEP